jgi:hypothetical protein
MTPGITCDSKSLMTDWLGPLVQPRFPLRYLTDSRAWPSPLWAYNTFSYVLFLSFDSRRPYVLFPSVPFYSTMPLTSFTSIAILFDSFRLVSPLFFTVPCLARDLLVSLYINHCTI